MYLGAHFDMTVHPSADVKLIALLNYVGLCGLFLKHTPRPNTRLSFYYQGSWGADSHSGRYTLRPCPVALDVETLEFQD